MPDIHTADDVKKMVTVFYDRVKQDNLLGPIFDDMIGDYWDEHLEKLVRFWETIILKTKSYTGSAFEVHMKMPIGKQHFEVWEKVFIETVDDLFQGEKAEHAKKFATCMAKNFPARIEECG